MIKNALFYNQEVKQVENKSTGKTGGGQKFWKMIFGKFGIFGKCLGMILLHSEHAGDVVCDSLNRPETTCRFVFPLVLLPGC